MTKTKEIDQRNKNDLLIRCNCGADHFLSFCYSSDDSKLFMAKPEKTSTKDKKTKRYLWKDYYICFIERSKGSDYWWWRLKDCYKYLFKKNKADLCYTGIGITSKDMERIIKHFREYQKI